MQDALQNTGRDFFVKHDALQNLPMKKVRRETSVQIRLMADEKEDFEEAARLSGLSLSAWIRRLVRIGAREELAKVGRKPSYNGHD
jgi:hypothetical protein